MLDATGEFWFGVLRGRPDDDGVVVAEGFSEHLRVLLRTFSMANAIRTSLGGRLLVVYGADRRWMDVVWPDLDPRRAAELAEAYGAHTFDLQAAAARLASTRDGVAQISVMDRVVTARLDDVDDDQLELLVRASWSRLEKERPYVVPPTGSPAHASYERHVRAVDAVWKAVAKAVRVSAFVTSHVDYDQWAPGVVESLRAGAPVVHVQSTGGLKAYAVWPDDRRTDEISFHAGHGETFRSILSPEIGATVRRIDDTRDAAVVAAAERIVDRHRRHLGRPSWWRSGANATLDLRGSSQRTAFRRWAARSLGIDPERPTLAVFNHAISDAPNSNVETFADLATWFEETVAYAAERTDVNWLLLDHPSQDLYDGTDHFASIGEKYDHEDRLVFRRSNTLTKNTIWSLADVGVTVRGSISNELPAFGIGAVQAGWSEWSHADFSYRADSPDDYWGILDGLIDDLGMGNGTATYGQMRRARLWQWFYRVGADVSTPFVPHWAALEGHAMASTLVRHLRHTEPDADPMFLAVKRLLHERASVLLRPGLTARMM